MNIALPGARSIVAPLVICLVLGAVLGAEYMLGYIARPSLPELPAPAAENPEESTAIPAPPEFILPPIARHTEIVNRPLFVPGRRNAPPPEEQTVGNLDNLTLIGTILMPNLRGAMFHDKEGRTYRIKEGQSVQGWRLAEVQPESVFLTNGRQRTQLLLRKFNKPGSQAVPLRPFPSPVPPTPVPAVPPSSSSGASAPAVVVDPAAQAAKHAEKAQRREALRAEREARRADRKNGRDKHGKD